MHGQGQHGHASSYVSISQDLGHGLSSSGISNLGNLAGRSGSIVGSSLGGLGSGSLLGGHANSYVSLNQHYTGSSINSLGGGQSLGNSLSHLSSLGSSSGNEEHVNLKFDVNLFCVIYSILEPP